MHHVSQSAPPLLILLRSFPASLDLKPRQDDRESKTLRLRALPRLPLRTFIK